MTFSFFVGLTMVIAAVAYMIGVSASAYVTASTVHKAADIEIRDGFSFKGFTLGRVSKIHMPAYEKEPSKPARSDGSMR